MSKKTTFYFNPNNKKKSFDVYINKNPKDTIPIKYKTLKDVKNTIIKLEELYKRDKYEHTRIWKVGMILYVRLKVLKDKKPSHFKLAKRYFKFLGKRTKINGKDKRKELTFFKKKSKKINMNNIPKSQFNNKRSYLLDKCGLPDVDETSHCFNDSTHHTCCHLSEEARQYADKSGNPIGKLSEDVYNKLADSHHLKSYFKKTNKRPWCTCFGSKVCGNYASKFNQSSDINFISDPHTNSYASSIYGSEGCEEHVRNKFNVSKHGTPGIYSNNVNPCSQKKNIKYSKFKL